MTKNRKIIFPSLALTLLLTGFTAGYYNPYGGGYYNCTWTAWQLAFEKTGVSLPNFGNAGNWYYAAMSSGYYVDKFPSANSIVVWSGHVGYVDDYDPATNMMFVEQGGMRITSSGYWAGWMNVGSSLGGQGLIGFIHLDGMPGYSYDGSGGTYIYTDEYGYTDEYALDDIYYYDDDDDFPTLAMQEASREIVASQRQEAADLVRERPMINTFAISIDSAKPTREIPDEKHSPKLVGDEEIKPSGIPTDVRIILDEKEAEKIETESETDKPANENKMSAPLNLF